MSLPSVPQFPAISPAPAAGSPAKLLTQDVFAPRTPCCRSAENFARQSSGRRRRLSCTWSPVERRLLIFQRDGHAFPSFEKLRAAETDVAKFFPRPSEIAESCTARRNEQSTQQLEGDSNLIKKLHHARCFAFSQGEISHRCQPLDIIRQSAIKQISIIYFSESRAIFRK